MRDATFALAIDVGSSRVTAAVVHDSREAHDAPVLFSLSANENSAPSAAFIDRDGSVHFGDEAERLGAADPRRLAREFTHDVGTDAPLVVGEHAVAAEDLVAGLCAWVVGQVAAAEGEAPDLVAITHPASWAGHRLERLRAALEQAEIHDPVLITESEAAAAQVEESHPVGPGQLLAVYDLGGTRFDARVLRRRSGGRYQPVGEHVRIEQLGGANFDDALLRHVLAGAAGHQVLGGAASGDEETRAAVARVRAEVIAAKEMLSSAGDAAVRLALPEGEASVRVTRSEFEAMIDDDLDRTVEALDLAIESAAAGTDRLEAIVLAGGSARIPLVAQRLSQRFDLPIIADADPQSTTALGAARIAGRQLRAEETAPGTALATVTPIEKAPAPRPEQAPQRAGVLAFLRPVIGGKTRSTSPLLLAGAAVFIAVTIVFSSTTAAGTRWPDYIQQAASDLLHLPKPPGSATSPPPSASAPPANAPDAEQQTASADGTRQSTEGSRKSTRPPSTSPTAAPRGGGPQAEPSAPPSSTKPTATSNTPGTTSPGTTSPNPGETPPDQTTPPDTTTPDTTPPTTTDPVQPDPAPVDPAPVDPAPVEPTPVDPTPVDPAPADPAPAEPAVEPAPATEQPAPEPTAGPVSEPA